MLFDCANAIKQNEERCQLLNHAKHPASILQVYCLVCPFVFRPCCVMLFTTSYAHKHPFNHHWMIFFPSCCNHAFQYLWGDSTKKIWIDWLLIGRNCLSGESSDCVVFYFLFHINAFVPKVKVSILSVIWNYWLGKTVWVEGVQIVPSLPKEYF